MKPISLDPQLLLAHGAFVRGVARAVLGGDDEVDDVVQDTWLAALGQAPGDRSALRAWLGGIARRQAALRIRTRVRERRRLGSLAARARGRPRARRTRSRSPRPRRRARRLVAAVLTLPEHYRTAVLLRYHDDLPPREVAARLGVPVETVRTRVRRGLALLRERMDASDDRGVWRAALLPLCARRARGRAGRLRPGDRRWCRVHEAPDHRGRDPAPDRGCPVAPAVARSRRR